VARIVDAVSDTDQSPKPPWRERKEAYIERLPSEPYSVRLVVAADKLHNLRDLLSSYRVQGDDLWTHFKGGRDGTLWYYHAVVDALVAAAKPEENQLRAITEEIDRTLAALQQEIAEQDLAAAARDLS
jgi:(p)ppGpp synthase/HD superfamily hydrolase